MDIPVRRYECQVCVPVSDCKYEPLCNALPDGTAVCPLPNLKPSKKYNVTCTAIRADSSRSPPSNTDELTTDQAV